jgi:hypothetical protein
VRKVTTFLNEPQLPGTPQTLQAAVPFTAVPVLHVPEINHLTLGHAVVVVVPGQAALPQACVVQPHEGQLVAAWPPTTERASRSPTGSIGDEIQSCAAIRPPTATKAARIDLIIFKASSPRIKPRET